VVAVRRAVFAGEVDDPSAACAFED